MVSVVVVAATVLEEEKTRRRKRRKKKERLSGTCYDEKLDGVSAMYVYTGRESNRSLTDDTID